MNVHDPNMPLQYSATTRAAVQITLTKIFLLTRKLFLYVCMLKKSLAFGERMKIKAKKNFWQNIIEAKV